MKTLEKSFLKNDYFTIVIPTLQKNTQVLTLLIDELVLNDCVGEILLIDNSLKGFNYNSDKVKVIIPNKNLYVNGSWNFGIKLARFNNIGILNDDILIPNNLCEQILQKLRSDENCGLIGMNSEILCSMDESQMTEIPQNLTVDFIKQEDNLCINHWGAAIFGKKNNFYHIPNNIKIYFGDNYLIHKNILKNKTNYQTDKLVIKHLGSLSSGAESLSEIKTRDAYNYAQIDKRFKQHCWYRRYPSLLEQMFSVKNKDIHKVVTLLGIKMKFTDKNRVKAKIARERFETIHNKINHVEQQLDLFRIQCSRLNLLSDKQTCKIGGGGGSPVCRFGYPQT